MKRELDVERAHELLAQRATEGLDATDEATLAELAPDDDGFDLAAAAIDLATLVPEALPPAIAAQVIATARLAVTPLTAAPASPMTAPAVPAVAADLPERAVGRRPAVPAPSAPRRPPVRPRWSTRAMVMSCAATAVAVALAAGAWVDQARRSPAGPAASPAVATASERAELEATGDARTAPWRPGPDPAGRTAAGVVVWSAQRQRGVARLSGLAPSASMRERYQLWIFDGTRDVRYPVDGGLFDVPASGAVTIDVTGSLPVADAQQFVITLEQPGGAVVSDRTRVVMTAELDPPR